MIKEQEKDMKFRDFGEEIIAKKYFQTNVQYVEDENHCVNREALWIIDPKLLEAFLKEWDAYQNRPFCSDG